MLDSHPDYYEPILKSAQAFIENRQPKPCAEQRFIRKDGLMGW
jgi:hypothetical protein